jgi:hypothetical protein
VLKHITVDLNDPAIYNLMINTTDLSIEETARFIVDGMACSGIIKL